ncbi:MAG: C39 family peptidase [Nitrospirae bacterium]|nr:C39 family peptidase [Nitrospirota bacterium]
MDIFKKSNKTPRLRAAGVFLFSGLIFAALAGCSAGSHGYTTEAGFNTPLSSSYIPDVPFYPGEDYQCGPSVLAGVLNYRGYDIKPEDISKEIYLKNIRGTLNIDMAAFARRFDDADVREFQGNITFLKENLSMNNPLIVFVDLGIWNIRKGHYMLVVGHDDTAGGFIVYSGAEKDKVISYKDFMRIWKRGSYWALRITKK